MTEKVNAGQEPVKKPEELNNETAAPKSQSELDYEALLASKEAELTKVREEKENYRRGLLKAKAKVDEEESQVDLTSDDRLRQIVREEVLSAQEAKIQAEKDSLVKEAFKKVSELSLALKNKSQMTSSGGNSTEAIAGNDQFWSAEQIAFFKSKGLDPAKVKENFLKKQK